jgi:hypothetical protein
MLRRVTRSRLVAVMRRHAILGFFVAVFGVSAAALVTVGATRVSPGQEAFWYAAYRSCSHCRRAGSR